MKAKTELLLYRLFWLAEKPFNPTFQNLEQSFEGWAYRNGLLTQIHRLEAQGFIETLNDPASGKRLHRLTEAGMNAANGGRDPEQAWATPWDGKWRLFLFDIPEAENTKRRQLTRALAISPSTPPAIEKLIASDDPDCTHLMLLMADTKGQKVDVRMVEGAWNFDQINEQYEKLETILDEFPAVAQQNSPEVLADWTAAEKASSSIALQIDPLLPSALYPKIYVGRKIWKKRIKILADAARHASGLTV
jgi:DNA-binding transcriptional regulator PaaX